MKDLESLTRDELRKIAKKAGLRVSGTKAKLVERLKADQPKKVVEGEPEVVADVSKSEVEKPSLTYLGEGPMSGEFRFAEIPGSIAARSKEEAIKKAEEIAAKHSNLLNN